jgi:hypothetical protein
MEEFMGRLARVVLPGVVHHITQRGVRSMDIFYSEKDRKEYLFLLNQQAEKAGLRYVAYCLMTNHVHLLAIPYKEDSLRDGVLVKPIVYIRVILILEKKPGDTYFKGVSFPVPWMMLIL